EVAEKAISILLDCVTAVLASEICPAETAIAPAAQEADRLEQLVDAFKYMFEGATRSSVANATL
ncbi:hypothetical protein FRC03_007758, partial [Tulasnella sp. 419]